MVARVKKPSFFNLLMVSVIVIIIVCMVAVGLFLLNNSTVNPIHKFMLPKGFTGWVEVTYEQTGFPALKKEGRAFIYEVPPSGKVMTSSQNVSGTMVLIYVEQDGRQIAAPTNVSTIHGQGTSGGEIGGPNGQTEKLPEKLTFFVGTEEQWQAAKEKRP